jgi:cysteine desulfurase
MRDIIYCDYNATTPIDNRVLDAMMPWLTSQYGNASARIYPQGRMAYEAIEHSRKILANFLQADKEEIIFTSGATEAVNLAMRGVFELYQKRGKHILISPTEHKAVIETARALEKHGAEVEYLSLSCSGMIDIDHLTKSIRPDTIMICVMLVNNETGIVQAIDEIGNIVHQSKAFLLCDATQAPGKIHFPELNRYADLIALSAHKIYGPKGIGLLYAKRKNPRVQLAAQISGGGQERGIRGGTLNVPGIVGFGKAVELLDDAEIQRIQKLRNTFEYKLKTLGAIKINGQEAVRAANVSNITFRSHTARELILALSNIAAVSTGSACSSDNNEPSHVLKAMGLNDSEALSTLRFSFGRYTTHQEIVELSDKIIALIDD